MYLFKSYFYPDMCPGVESLDQMTAQFSFFEETS